MRIQHNIMALNAYRNYTNNVSAMKKNLERLSSGYKINRAGDDAAGLAISEKMRAQITGLETASKNAKDGISLVQTAEGALTEVHDMLNRMVELATQSANGTYDNDTDRYQLQKELDQLREEIDRIADSANFNGIKLLDGSMDAGGDVVYTEGKFQIDNKALHPTGAGSNVLPDIGNVLGSDTVLHQSAITGNDTNKFSIDLHNLTLNVKGAIDIAIGDTKITVSNLSDKQLSAADIVAAIAAGGNDKAEVTIDGAKLNPGSVDFGSDVGKFKLEADDTRLNFTQVEGPDDAKIPAKVTITDAVTGDEDDFDVTGPKSTDVKVDEDAKTLEMDLTGMDVTGPGTVRIYVGDKLSKSVDGDGNHYYDIEITEAEYKNKNNKPIAEVVAEKLAAEINKDTEANGLGNDFKATFKDGKVTLTAKNAEAFAAAVETYKNFQIKVGKADDTDTDTELPVEMTISGPTNAVPAFASATGSGHATLTFDLAGLKAENLTAGKISVTFGSASNPYIDVEIEIDETDIAGLDSTDDDAFAKLVASKLATELSGESFASIAGSNGSFSFAFASVSGTQIIFAAASGTVASLASGVTVDDLAISITPSKDNSKYMRAVGDTQEITIFTSKVMEPAGGAIGIGSSATAATSAFGGIGSATVIGSSSINWTAASGASLTSLASQVIAVDIGGTTYTVAIASGSGTDNASTVYLASGTSAAALLKQIENALNSQLAAKAAVGAQGSTDYSALNVTLTGASGGKISVSYVETQYTPSKITLVEGEGTTATASVSGDLAATLASLASSASIDWSKGSYALGSATLASFASKTIEVTINGTKLTVTFATASGSSITVDGGTIKIGSEASGVTINDLLSKINEAFANQLEAAGLNKPQAVGSDYFSYNNVEVSFSASGVISAEYIKTPYTVQDTSDTNEAQPDKLPENVSAAPVFPDLGVDFTDEANLSLSISSVPGLADAIQALEDNGPIKITTEDGDELTVDLTGLTGDIDLQNGQVKDVLDAIKARFEDAIGKWNAANTDKDYHYEWNGFVNQAGETVYRSTGNELYGTVKKVMNPTTSSFSGDYNVSTTVIETKRTDEAERLASTYFDLTEDMVKEGSTITIGRDTYTFTTDKTKIGKDGYVVYNEGDELESIAEKLTAAAKNNKTYTVGYDGSRITITEVVDQTNFDLTTAEGIEKSLGFKMAKTNPTDTSKGLTLQIGDTAESYNQLKVNIKDCHTKALGIDGISIANQADAADAIDKIKAAINQVSDIRGTLGATQNRLDHTINNLSVMTENIQDAESTIRDTDIAEEMMAYTKNNILIQAAQAMLAQANQVPQGVLQLLQ